MLTTDTPVGAPGIARVEEADDAKLDPAML
jgi:hypothetical protein